MWELEILAVRKITLWLVNQAKFYLKVIERTSVRTSCCHFYRVTSGNNSTAGQPPALLAFCQPVFTICTHTAGTEACQSYMRAIKEIRGEEEKRCNFLKNLSLPWYTPDCHCPAHEIIFPFFTRWNIEKTLTGLLTGFQHTVLPSHWDSVSSWQEVQGPCLLPCCQGQSHAMVTEPLARLHRTERALGSCQHLIQGAISSTSCEEIYVARLRAANIKASSNLPPSSTGNGALLFPQHVAPTSPHIFTVLQFPLPRMAWSFHRITESSNCSCWKGP